MDIDKDKAELFYQMLAGTTYGQMAQVPNNRDVWTFLSIVGDHGPSNMFAMSKEQFIELLREVADELEK